MAINRVGGLASGMDIDALVAKLMSAEKAPLYKLQQQKTKYEWQRDAYRGVNTKLKTYDTYVFDNFRLSSSMGKKTPTVSDTTKVGVTAGAGATGSLSIDAVQQMATSARLNGSLTGTTNKTLAKSTDSLADVLGFANVSPIPSELKLTVNSKNEDGTPVLDENQQPVTKEITIDTSKSMDEIITKLREDGVNAGFDAKTGAFAFAPKGKDEIVVDAGSQAAFSALGMTVDPNTGESKTKPLWTDATSAIDKNTKLGEIGLAGGKITIEVPSATGALISKTVEFKETDSVDSFLKSLNSAGVTALMGMDGKISITANATGTGNVSMTAVEGDGAALLNKLGLDDPANSVDGKNAMFTVNGVQMEERSNKANISGYEITLKQEFSSGAVTIESSADVQGLVDKIKEFVSTYNGLIADLNGQLKEDKYRKYAPLTSEQRESMKENEIKLWEEKAKSGLLRNDSIIREGLANMRSIFSGSIAGLNDKTIDSFSELGIATSNQVSDNGKLIIDENKLRAAIEKDPDQVISIFSNTGEVKKELNANGRMETIDSRGIAQRMKDSLTAVMADIEKKAGKSTHTDQQYSIGKNLVGLDTRIDRLNVRMVNLEARYWKQFTAMETAINKANSQSGMFSQFTGQ
ncbi:flagellar filament capping protein FliD [Psychrobacillus sp.]|uniref:flagellar filament capping protein FliD n=1 Tax=Psychrobacillus sp. TaxID=1871623 RepID=UPI0028BD3813|nr:flagellar filament capping protein FliD [Psychrobacillus sp.]